MAQILDPLPKNSANPLLCCYINATSQIQVARITNIPNWYFERVVFPGQRLVFEALPHAQLEIHTGMMASSILSDTIPCNRLTVTTESNGIEDSTPKEDTHTVKNCEDPFGGGSQSSTNGEKEPALASVE
ncbi:DUF1830 domain-containing protein [Baaleninema simplex]|uniref:DUF1830 domain-containing protein n=1 Tax=Baaleninema simplex TaxID=2862350 RepID=UPI0003478DAA|nr:DUF1830 domain-containing protein [Baaleninema simplex]